MFIVSLIYFTVAHIFGSISWVYCSRFITFQIVHSMCGLVAMYCSLRSREPFSTWKVFPLSGSWCHMLVVRALRDILEFVLVSQ